LYLVSRYRGERFTALDRPIPRAAALRAEGDEVEGETVLGHGTDDKGKGRFF
jgi:hypothetical protein